MRHPIATASAALGLVLLSGCSLPPRNAQNQFDPRQPGLVSPLKSPSFQRVNTGRRVTRSMLSATGVDFRLGPGDQMEIELEGKPDTLDETFVTPDGMVYYHIAEGVPAAGKTIGQLQASLTEALSAYLKPPIVVRITLTNVKSRDYSVMGAVTSPGVYPLNRPVTLLDAVSQAGGVYNRLQVGNESYADLARSYVVRSGQVLPIDFDALIKGGDMSQNIYLQPGDHVYIPSSESSSVYVLGSVRTPQSVGYTPNVTLVNAVSKAGGLTPMAYGTKVVIIRGALHQPYVAVVDYRDILTGKATDVQLAPGDIVWVSKSPFKLTKRFVLRMVDAAARGVAVTQGIQLVDPDASTTAAVGVGGG